MLLLADGLHRLGMRVNPLQVKFVLPLGKQRGRYYIATSTLFFYSNTQFTNPSAFTLIPA